MNKGFFSKMAASREMSLIVILAALCIFIQIRSHSFLSLSNLNDLVINGIMMSILAVGMMCVLLIGGIDISIGSTVALSGMVTALIMRNKTNFPTIFAFLIGIGVGMLCGLIIGVVIVKGKVIPIIATMGFMNIYRGATYLVADNQWVASYQMPESFKKFAVGSIFGINNMILTAIAVYLLFAYFIKYTAPGRKIYAVGSNAEAAKISGINTGTVKLFVYSLMGALAGLVGVLWISKYASAQGDAASGFEIDIIAACVIGGVSLNGGKGTVFGVILGSLTLAILNNALPLINVSPFWQDAIKGLVIIGAIIINVMTQRAMDKNNRKRREI